MEVRAFYEKNKQNIINCFSLVMVMAAISGCAKNGSANTSNQNNQNTQNSQNNAPASGNENKQEENNTDSQFPISKEKITLRVMAQRSDNQPDWNDIYVWKKYEEMTNIHIDWIQVSSSDSKEKVSAAIASNDLPDLFFRCGISAINQKLYGDQGFFVNLAENDMLKKYAPNFWAYLQEHKDTLASVQYPDGSIYSFPQVNDGAELRVSRKLFINKNWLNNVGMELPTTLDELYTILKAFKEKDANGNGDPNDEIPFCSMTWAGIQDVLVGAFGIQNRGVHNSLVDWDEQNNRARFIPTTEGWKEFLQYTNKLYTEGLMDQETFTMTTQNWITKAADDKVGMFAYTNMAFVPSDKVENFVALEEALEGPHGDKLWAPIRAHFHSTGAAVITSANKYVPETLRWLDYFWTDEGTLFYHFGVEGETYVAKADGTYDWTDKIYAEMTGNKTFDEVVSSYSPYTGGNNPVIEKAPYFSGGEVQPVPAASARAMFNYGPKVYWPSFTFTLEESDELNALETDINKYVKNARTEFVTGARSLSDWNNYVKDLEKMDVARLLEIYTTAIERYDALLNK